MKTTTLAAISLILSIGLLVLPDPAGAALISYDFATDPGWLEVGNRPADGLGQDFGFSSGTSHAGGAPSEIGGMFDRSGAGVAYYGTHVGTFDLHHPFEMNWTSANPANMFYGDFGNGAGQQAWAFGFFDRHAKIAPHPADSLMGVEISDNNMYSAMFFPGTGNNETQFASGLVSSTLHTLRLKYDPNLGSGRLSVDFDGSVSTFNLTAAQRASGAAYDTFGFLAIAAGGANASSPGDAYVDNLAVTPPIYQPATTSYDFATDPGWIGVGACAGLRSWN